MTQVLVVEDDPDIQDMLSIRLTMAGFAVTVASDVVTAHAYARRTRPDVIVLDVQLPGMNGLEFCRRVRADPELTGVAILVATATVGDQAVADAFAAGADEFLAKPYSLAELVGHIRALARLTEPAPANDSLPAY